MYPLLFQVFFWNLFTKIRADYVYIFEVSPMTQALPGVWYAKKRKIPCYLYVTDLWPENVEIVAGVTNKKILNAIGAMVDYIYKRCDRIFTSSQSFVQAIADRGIDKDKLEFWPNTQRITINRWMNLKHMYQKFHKMELLISYLQVT